MKKIYAFVIGLTVLLLMASSASASKTKMTATDSISFTGSDPSSSIKVSINAVQQIGTDLGNAAQLVDKDKGNAQLVWKKTGKAAQLVGKDKGNAAKKVFGDTSVSIYYRDSSGTYYISDYPLVLIPTDYFKFNFDSPTLSIPSIILSHYNSDGTKTSITLSNINLKWHGYGNRNIMESMTMLIVRYATITGTFETSDGKTIDVGTLTPAISDVNKNPACMISRNICLD